MPNEQDVRIGARITEAREYLDLSVEELGEMLGVENADLHAVESGQEPVTAALLVVLSAKLGRGMEFFTGNVPAAVAAERTAFLARAAETLSEHDMGELQRFATYLRSRSEGAAA